MKKILWPLLVLSSAVAQEQKAVPVNPVDKQAFQTLRGEIETLNARMRAVQAEMEVIRLRSCMASSVALPECGQWTQDGQIPRVEKPKP